MTKRKPGRGVRGSHHAHAVVDEAGRAVQTVLVVDPATGAVERRPLPPAELRIPSRREQIALTAVRPVKRALDMLTLDKVARSIAAAEEA